MTITTVGYDSSPKTLLGKVWMPLNWNFLSHLQKNPGICGVLRPVRGLLPHPTHPHHCEQLRRILQEQALEKWGDFLSPYVVLFGFRSLTKRWPTRRRSDCQKQKLRSRRRWRRERRRRTKSWLPCDLETNQSIKKEKMECFSCMCQLLHCTCK